MTKNIYNDKKIYKMIKKKYKMTKKKYKMTKEKKIYIIIIIIIHRVKLLDHFYFQWFSLVLFISKLPNTR